jgi:hypothetical protein
MYESQDFWTPSLFAKNVATIGQNRHLYNNTGRGLAKVALGGFVSPRNLARSEVMHYPDAMGG